MATTDCSLPLSIPRNNFSIDVGKDAGSVMKVAEKPPIAECAADLGLENRIGQDEVEQYIDLTNGASGMTGGKHGRS